MNRIATFALVLALAGCSTGSSQLRQSVERDLRQLGFTSVDVDTLSSSQLSAIHAVASSKPQSNQRAIIRSILGGRNSLRGVFR